MRRRERYGWLFNAAIRIFKYFCLILFGFGVACILASLLGMDSLLESLLDVREWMFRVGVVVSCLMAIAVFGESLRS